MKKKFLKRATLFVALSLFIVKLWALDQITFTWQAINTKSVSIKATSGKLFTVNWGDGVIETKTGSGDNWIDLTHNYTNIGEYTVSIETPEGSCMFTHINCNHIDHINNRISLLDLTHCPSLVYLDCYYNQLTQLDLSQCPNLKTLYCGANPLTHLNLLGCLALEMLWFTNTTLTYLDLTGCSALIFFHCPQNQLKSIELRGCTALKSVSCRGNKLQNLDLSDCPAIDNLYCDDNQLTHINLSGCQYLKSFACDNNQLAHLDLSDCTALQNIYCTLNRLRLSDLYEVHLLVQNASTKLFGTQHLPLQFVYVGEELFSDQSVFNGKFTQYTVLKNGSPALSIDYQVVEGKLTINTTGYYTVSMTNSAIVSDLSAKVIATLDVCNVGIAELPLSNILVYPNPTTGELRVESEELRVNNVEIFDIYGRKCLSTQYSLLNTNINISHLQAGIYVVKFFTDKGIFTKEVIKN